MSEPVFRPSSPPIAQAEPATNHPEMEKMQHERVQKLKALSEKLKTHAPLETHLHEIESVPAYKRRNVELSDVQPSSESQAARYTLSGNSDKSIEIKTENTFLHNNVD